MRIISHRGNGKLTPENSIESIIKGSGLNVYGVEIDVRLSSDKKLVVFHDRSLKRLAGLKQEISKITLEQISKVKLKSGQIIPSLSEALNASDKLIIEGKDSDWANVLTDEIKNKETNVVRVISFNASELAKFRELNPSIDCFLITKFYSSKTIHLAKNNNFQGILVHWSQIGPYSYWASKNANLRINIFTFNNLLIAKLFGKIYKDIEITTNRPDKLQILNN